MSDPSSSKGRVLIAEDVNVLAMQMTYVLEEGGYAVEVAEDGDACLQKVFADRPDILLLDIMMPKKHGIEVLKALRADPRTDDLPVIVCSAKDFKTERQEAARLGAEFLTKPAPPGVLLERVEALLRTRAQGGDTAVAEPE